MIAAPLSFSGELSVAGQRQMCYTAFILSGGMLCEALSRFIGTKDKYEVRPQP